MARPPLSGWQFLLAVASLAAGNPVVCHAQQADAVAPRVAPIPLRNLQMTVSNPSDPRSERWIVWDSGFGEGQAAHIALCDMAGRCRWQHDWPDAYAPTIQYMGSWSTRQARVFMATYSQGAEAQTAIVIGLRKGQGPTVLAQEDGAWVAVAPQVNGLQMDTSSGLPVTMKCLRWDLSHMRFNDVRCR